MAINYSI